MCFQDTYITFSLPLYLYFSINAFATLIPPANRAKPEPFDKTNAGNPHKYRFSAFLSVIQTPLCKVVMWCFSLIFKAGIKEFYMVSTYCVNFLGIVLSFCCQYFTPAPTSQKDIIIAYLFFISFVIL